MDRFLKLLVDYNEILVQMFHTLVDELKEELPDLGVKTAVDSKAIPSFGRPVRNEDKHAESDCRRDTDAKHCFQSVTMSSPTTNPARSTAVAQRKERAKTRCKNWPSSVSKKTGVRSNIAAPPPRLTLNAQDEQSAKNSRQQG